MRRVRVPEGG
ncbi:hypothetical protein EC07798_1760, partial [Escherichia coli 07798]